MRLAAAALLLSAALAGCGGSALAPLDPPRPLEPVDARVDVDLLWAEEIGVGVDDFYLTLAPLVDGDRLFAVDREGRVEALDAVTGEHLWQVDLATPLTGGPGEGGDLLLLGAGAEVIALDKGNGGVRWRARASSEVLAPPVRIDQVAVVRSVDGAVTGHSMVDGRELWRYNEEVPLLTLRGASVPVAVDGVAAVGLANGSLVALDAASGRVLWDATVAVPRGRTELERMVDLDATPALGERAIHVSAYQSRVAAVAVEDGRILWARDMGSHSGLAWADGTVYVADSRGDIWALSDANGATLWKQDALHGRRLGAPVIQGDYLVVGDYEGWVHWLDRERGHVVGRARVHEPSLDQPAFVSAAGYDLNRVEDRAVMARPAVWERRLYALDKRGMLNAFSVRPHKP